MKVIKNYFPVTRTVFKQNLNKKKIVRANFQAWDCDLEERAQFDANKCAPFRNDIQNAHFVFHVDRSLGLLLLLNDKATRKEKN